MLAVLYHARSPGRALRDYDVCVDRMCDTPAGATVVQHAWNRILEGLFMLRSLLCTRPPRLSAMPCVEVLGDPRSDLLHDP